MRTLDGLAWFGLLAILSTGCAASPTWRGVITDCRTTAPVAGADVHIDVAEPVSASNVTSTDDAGRYAFIIVGDSKKAHATLTVAKRGYQTVQKSYSGAAGEDTVCMSPTR